MENELPMEDYALPECIAKAFCEASGNYKWDDTTGKTRQWYIEGAKAIIKELKIKEDNGS